MKTVTSNTHISDPLPAFEEIFVKADGGIHIYCRVFGKGKPIIIVHGGPGSTQDYLLPQMAKLAENNRVIIYDQRGCKRSLDEINDSSIQVETFINDIESIRKSFGYTKIILIGHSWGGFLSMEYAIAYPESLEKLVLMNTAPASSKDYDLLISEFTRRMAPFQNQLKTIKESREFMEGNPVAHEEYYRIIYRRYCYEPEKADLLDLYASPGDCLNAQKVSEIFTRNLFSKPFDLHKQLNSVNVPTLIIHGDSDVVPPIAAQNIHESIQGSAYILMENCGHFPYVENPDQLFKHLNAFLR